MYVLKAHKSLGQNYLTDPNIIRKIVNEINVSGNEKIIEIGPGTGALTTLLYELSTDLTVIDIDSRVKEMLLEQMPGLNIIIEDFLTIDLHALADGKKIKIAGNIPYNITSPIIFKLIENIEIVNEAILMVQHEVARRMSAVKGTKDYGILSVILSYIAEVKYCFKVSANVFNPKPKVDSAVIHINFKQPEKQDFDLRFFINIVKASFGNRRKTLKNSLSNSIFRHCDFSKINLDLSKRAEQLNLQEFVVLANEIRKQVDGTGK